MAANSQPAANPVLMFFLKKSWHLIVAAILTAFVFGLESQTFQASFSSLPEAAPWQYVLLWCSVPIGATVGNLLFMKIVEWIGTVISFQLTSLLWLAGAIMSIFVRNIYLLMAARALTGLGQGVMMGSALVYIAQMAQSKGFVLSVAYASGIAGNMAGFGIYGLLESSLTGNWPKTVLLILQAAWVVILFFMAFFVPEFPPWLQWRGFNDKSNEIGYALSPRVFGESGSSCSLKEIFYLHRAAIFRALSALALLQLVGAAHLVLSSSSVLVQCQVPETQLASYFYAIWGVTAVFALVFSPLVQYVSRKDSLVYGYLLTGGSYLTLFFLLRYFGAGDETGSLLKIALSSPHNSAFLAVYIYLSAVYTSVVGVISVLYTIETFSPEARSKGIFMAVALAWTLYGGFGIAFPWLLRWAQEWSFLALGVCGLLGSVVYMFLPDSKAPKREKRDDLREEEQVAILTSSARLDSSATVIDSEPKPYMAKTPKLFGYRKSRKSPKLPSPVRKRGSLANNTVSARSVTVKPLSLLSPGTRFQTAGTESPKSEASNNSQSTVVLKSAKAHQSVKSPMLGSHLDELWSESEVGYQVRSQNTAHNPEAPKRRSPFRSKLARRKQHSATSGIKIGENPEALFGKQPGPPKRGFLNANSGESVDTT